MGVSQLHKFHGNKMPFRFTIQSAISFIILALAYFFGVSNALMWSDDFAAYSDNYANSEHIFRDGRPIGAVLLYATFFLIKQNLIFCLFFNLLGFAGINFLMRWLVRELPNFRFTKFSKELIIAIGMCLPSFQVQVHWIHMWYASWISILALNSYLDFLKKPKSFSPYFGLIIVFLIYPTMAFWIFSYGAIRIFEESKSFKLKFLLLIRTVKYFFTSSLIAFLIAYLFISITNSNFNERVGLINYPSIFQKIEWFITRPVALSFRFFFVQNATYQIVQIFTFVMFLWFFLLLRKYYKALHPKKFLSNLILFCFWLFILPLSHLLFTENNQIEFRMIPSYAFSIFFLFMVLIFRNNINKKYTYFCLMILASIAIFTTNIRYINLIYKPYQINQKFIADTLADCLNNEKNLQISIIKLKKPLEHKQMIGDFSMITDLEYSWVPRGSVQYSARLHYGNKYSNIRVRENIDGESSENYCVLDLNRLHQLFSK